MDQQLYNHFLSLKKRAIDKDFKRMNDMQRQAVYTVNGPLLILAGAGSGKTTVLVNRIANMIKYGAGYLSAYMPEDISENDIKEIENYIDDKPCDEEKVHELISYKPVKPWNILAITFTNKAAGELKERLHSMLGADTADMITAATFHSACVRILRRYIDRLGYTSSFTIYDTDDSQRVIKDVLKTMNIDEKMFPAKGVLNSISRAKDKMMTPAAMLAEAAKDFRLQTVAKIYQEYQDRLQKSNALDFDDIIVKTVQLLRNEDDVLEYYRNRYLYIMVDEYQDTNTAQFELVNILSQEHKNICVVGDDDQSIYKFRGATIENILNFEDQFPNAKVIRLEQNYRCTKNILNAANEVIAKNVKRKGKTLWTDNEVGSPIHIHRTFDEQREAQDIAEIILENAKNGVQFKDNAILYRMNVQSNAIEKCFVRLGIPYKIIGGLRFYERKEIKDIIAYLSVINNQNDSVRLRRIINEPKRGIGDTTLATAQQIADQLSIGLFDVLREADQYAALSKKSRVLCDFTQIIDELVDISEESPLDVLLDELLEKSGYMKYMERLGFEGQTRIENINELKTNILKYMEENEEASLSGFLEEVSLYTDIDRMDDDNSVTMMTIHSAKGLEFDNVFIPGIEDGIFPGVQSIYNPEELEEERRLCYVALTRARKNLYLYNVAHRMLFGQTARNKPSRFLNDIPTELCEIKDDTFVSTHTERLTPKEIAKKSADAGRSIGISAVKKRPAAAASGSKISFSAGDTVNHKVFGKGMVLSASPMGNDTLVEVAFEKVGTKKIMANFSKLSKI